jgi:chloramphenicol 3-O-phosphotransferase
MRRKDSRWQNAELPLTSWPMNSSTQIILLNGVGSSGKSIAKQLQKIAGKPYLHVQMDGSFRWFAFEEISENGKSLVVMAMRGLANH